MRIALAIVFLLIAAVVAGCNLPEGSDQTIGVPGGYAVVHVPVAHSAIGVVVLHSVDNRPAELIAQGWNQLSDTAHFVAIYPYFGGSWNAGLCCGTAAANNEDDVSMLTAAILALRLRYGLDRIYVAGNSNGAMMAERLVVERPWLTSRIAVWGGAPEMPTAGQWTGYAAIFDGTKDKTVPWAGGMTYISGRSVEIRPALTTGDWLIGAQRKGFLMPGLGHAPPKNWPELAWQQLKP